MNLQEKEIFEKISSDFSKIKKAKKLGIASEEDIIKDISVLLGIYGFYKSKLIEKQIEEMLSFGEKHKWAMQGQIIEFERLKQGLLKIKKVKLATRKTKKK